MKYWLYRWFMSFAHRYGWHKMEESHPDGDTMLWCHWCGLRVVTKRHLTQHAPDAEAGVRIVNRIDDPLGLITGKPDTFYPASRL